MGELEGLPDHPDHPLVARYLSGRAPDIPTFGAKGGRDGGTKFQDALKLNASSSRLYVSGPMYGRTKARFIASKPWRVGSITTTGIELIAPSAALRRWRDFLRRETTS